MEKAKEEKILYLAKQIPKLPDKAKNAVLFLIDNFDLIEKMSKAASMTETEIQNRMAKAKEKEDYISMIIFCTAKMLRNGEN